MMKLSGMWTQLVVTGALVCFCSAGAFAQEESSRAAKKISPSQPTTPAEEPKVDPLAEQVDEAIEISSRRYLTVGTHTPWQIMHGVLALRGDFQLKQGDKKINTLEWLSDNTTYRGEPLFEKTRHGGRAHPYSEPYVFEGHANQFLAIFAMANLPSDFEIETPQGTITVADMVKNAQMEITGREEVAWTLWALSHYLEPDARWTNAYGEPWSLERVVQTQTSEPVWNGACGGTHGLFALSYARNAYLQSGRQLRGSWLEAHQKILRYTEEARSLQNQDGSFSSSYFEGRRLTNDFVERLATTGHTLEFLMMALPQDRLEEEWVRRAVGALSQDLIDNRRSPADCGPLYHALHALVLYRERTRPNQSASTVQDKTDEEVVAPQEAESDVQESVQTSPESTTDSAE